MPKTLVVWIARACTLIDRLHVPHRLSRHELPQCLRLDAERPKFPVGTRDATSSPPERLIMGIMGAVGVGVSGYGVGYEILNAQEERMAASP